MRVQSLNLLIDILNFHVISHVIRLGEDDLRLVRHDSLAHYVNAGVALVPAPLTKHKLLILGFECLLGAERSVLLWK